MCKNFQTFFFFFVKSKLILISVLDIKWHGTKKKYSLCLQNKLKNKQIKPLLIPPFITLPHCSLTPAVPYGPCCTLTCALLQARSSAISQWAEVFHAALGLSEMGILPVTLPPGPVEQFDFCQAFADHGGKEKGEENTTDQHVVVVIF